MQEHVDAAVLYSTEAAEYLRKSETLSALQTEEVLFNHYCVLKADGQDAEARIYLNRAHEILQRKAASIKNENHGEAL
jgi:hypothetical protein